MNWFIIKGLSPFLDGMIVEGYSDGNLVTVRRLVNQNVMFGDRDLSFSFPDNSFMLAPKSLQLISNPELREYDGSNPWGKYVCEGRLTRNNIEVSWAEYEYNVQVTVQEKVAGQPTKTLFTTNFDLNDYTTESVLDTIQECIRDDDSLEDLIFNLRDLQDDG